MTTPPKITGPNAVGLRLFPIMTPLVARVGQLSLGHWMRTAICQFLLVAAISCTVIGCAGRATDRRGSDSPALWQASAFHPPMPDSSFLSFEAAFRYIARCEGLPSDSHTLFALAADSTLERSHSHLIAPGLIREPLTARH